MGSGIRTIPYLVSITISSIIVGTAITITGHYAAFLWVGAVVFTVGCAMLSTLGVNSSTGKWLGYQLIAGLGGGAAVQVPFLAVQVALSPEDSPVGSTYIPLSSYFGSLLICQLFTAAIIMFFNSLGGAISISIAQNIFSNQLIKQIPIYAPEVDPAVVIQAGATYLRHVVPAESLDGVLQAYAKALDTTFIPPIAFAGLSFIVALGVGGFFFGSRFCELC